MSNGRTQRPGGFGNRASIRDEPKSCISTRQHRGVGENLKIKKQRNIRQQKLIRILRLLPMIKDIRAERKQRTLDQRKKEILKVARKLVLKGGSHAVSMRKVADAVGYSTTILYAHFGDKGTLISNIVGEDMLRLNELVVQAAARGESTLERIRLAARAYVEYGLKFPEQYSLMYMEARPPTAVEQSSLQHGNPERDPYAFTCGLVKDLVQEGILAVDEATLHEITQVIWESIHGLISLRISIGADPWFPKVEPMQHLEFLLDALLAGLIQQYPGKKAGAALKALPAKR